MSRQTTESTKITGVNSEININLKIISQINEGDKLFVSQNLLQIDRSQRGVANATVRWYNNESRQQTMIQLNKIIRKAFEHMYTDSLIAANLEASVKGLIELKKTYIDDPTVVAQIDVLMEEISEKKVIQRYDEQQLNETQVENQQRNDNRISDNSVSDNNINDNRSKKKNNR